jgi:hypothetical protein
MSQKTAFITGITGQDGSYLAEFLLARDYRVVGLIRRSTNYHYPNIDHLSGKIALEFGDLMDAETVEMIVRQYQPDEVYHLAAQSVPADSWRQPFVTGEITALGACPRRGAEVEARCPLLPGDQPRDLWRRGARGRRRGDPLPGKQSLWRRQTVCPLDDARISRVL